MVDIRSFGILYTTKCQGKCGHCIISATPESSDQTSQQLMVSTLGQAKEAGIEEICFTGGEPLLYIDDIVEYVRLASGLGLITSVMTSCNWAEDTGQARSTVSRLASSGLTALGISWDRFHAATVCLDIALSTARIAAEHGIKVFIRTVATKGEDGQIIQAPFENIPSIWLEKPCLLQRFGRAAQLPEEFFQKFDHPPKGFCNMVSYPTMDANGNIYACCGPSFGVETHCPLRLGNATTQTLREILEKARASAILGYLSVFGPYGLYILLVNDNLEFPKRAYYSSFCELCLDLLESPKVLSFLPGLLDRQEIQRRLAAARLVLSNALSKKRSDLLRKSKASTPESGNH